MALENSIFTKSSSAVSAGRKAPFSWTEIANYGREGVASPGFLNVGFKCRSFGWRRCPETLRMTQQFLIFRPGNGHHFRVACLEIFRIFHVLIIPYFS